MNLWAYFADGFETAWGFRLPTLPRRIPVARYDCQPIPPIPVPRLTPTTGERITARRGVVSSMEMWGQGVVEVDRNHDPWKRETSGIYAR